MHLSLSLDRHIQTITLQFLWICQSTESYLPNAIALEFLEIPLTKRKQSVELILWGGGGIGRRKGLKIPR